MKAVLVKKDLSKYDLTDLISEVSFGGSVEQGARNLSLVVANNGIVYGAGDTIGFYDNDYSYVGQIQIKESYKKQAKITIDTEDYMTHLTRSKTTKIVNSTPEGVTAEICAEIGLATGSILATGMATGERVYENQSYFSIIKDLYSRAKKDVVIRMNGYKLEVVEKGDIVDYVIGDAVNISNISERESISEVVNKVVVYDKNHKKINEKITESAETIGIYQEVASEDDNLDAILKEQKNELIVDCLGDSTCIAGKYIRFLDSETGKYAIYEITEDKHNIDSKKHMMNLRLEFVRVE